jgi:hypothetical protein
MTIPMALVMQAIPTNKFTPNTQQQLAVGYFPFMKEKGGLM